MPFSLKAHGEHGGKYWGGTGEEGQLCEGREDRGEGSDSIVRRWGWS